MNNISSLTEQTITLVDGDAQHCNLVFTEFALNCAVALLCCSLARRFVPFLRDPRIRESEEDEGKHIFYGNVSSTLRHIRPRIDKPENIIQRFFSRKRHFFSHQNRFAFVWFTLWWFWEFLQLGQKLKLCEHLFNPVSHSC